ncbi:MFS transporter [Gordonia alkanivorans]|uniref:MFS transporter n=1 Tax=Gordonia alkanivorans TaxID=84096 RepID=UPI002448C9F3|nr:MFS transporter [Gordonia alkanivorans]MDH3047557.1 MFS transporter [Gordonia alkanivorans]
MTTIPNPVAVTPDPIARRFRRRRSPTTIIVILTLVEIISAFETSMVYATVPTIIKDFDSDASTVGWAITAFLLVAAASAAVCGRLGDMFGRERVLVVLLVGAIVGSLISAIGDSVTWIVVGRAIQGVAGAILPLLIGMAREHLPQDKVPVAVAMISGSAIAAGAGSAYVAGVVIDHASWHLLFIIAAIYAAFTLALVLFALPWKIPAGTTKKIDYIGTIAFAPAIAGILLAVNKAQTWGWTDTKTIGLLTAGIVVLVLWVMWELRVTDPIATVRLFTKRKVTLTMLITFMLAAGPFGIAPMINPIILQSPETGAFGVGMSPTDAGLLALAGALIGFCFTPISGRLTRAVGSRVALFVGCALYMVSYALMLFTYHSAWGMFFVVATGSTAVAFSYTAIPNLVVEAVPAENTSEANGLNSVVRSTGQGIGTSIASTILVASAVAGSVTPTLGGLQAVIAMMAIGTLVTFVLALRLKPGSASTKQS